MATGQVRTRTKEGLLIDEVRESPVDVALLRGRRLRFALLLLLAAAIVLVWFVRRT